MMDIIKSFIWLRQGVEMKKILIDMKDMSDSKEIYESRPNPLATSSIYCILGLLLVALLYSFVGEIEEVTEAFCVIRPNEALSTVASLRSGKIKNIYYTSGQEVKKGELLIDIEDTVERDSILLLNKKEKKLSQESKLIERFIKGITIGKNPFSKDINKKEYQYYVKFKTFELDTLGTEKNNNYEKKKNKANLEITKDRIRGLNINLNGVVRFKKSVITDAKSTGKNDKFDNLYKLYRAENESIKNTYEKEKDKILLDKVKEGAKFNLEYYKNQKIEYENLIKAIETGQEAEDTEGIGAILYKDYTANINEYRLNFLNAEKTYEFYKAGGNGGELSEDAVAHAKKMLNGYTAYRNSVIKGDELFDKQTDSAIYRDMYIKYKERYDSLAQFADIKKGEYLIKKYDPDSKELGRDIFEMNQAGEKRDKFKEDTLAEINDKILQIKEDIAAKEINLGKPSLEYNVEVSKLKMDSSQNQEEAYKAKMLSHYKEVLSELNGKVKEYELLDVSSKSKEELLADLKDNYERSKERQYFQTLSQIDEMEKGYSEELKSANSDLKLYEILDEMTQNNLDNDGKNLDISKMTISKISELLELKDSIIKQRDEIKSQVKQIKEELAKTEIRAEKDGIINNIMEFTEGDLLQSGQNLATIIPKEEGVYKTEIYVKNPDIARIKEGSSIRYQIEALPKEKFGLINGNIIRISKDSIVANGQFAGYYKVEGSIESDKITDDKGNRGEISAGMQAVAKILKEKKTIFKYIMDKLSIG